MDALRRRRHERRLPLRLKRRRYHSAELRRRVGRRVGARSIQPVGDAELSPEIEALLDRQREQTVRLQAEFENYRKRTKREIKEVRETAGAGIMQNILPILDNFSRALQSPGDSLEGFVEGIQMISKQFDALLGEAGLETIEAMGQPFDPNIHDAVAVDSSGEHPENTVVEVLQVGFAIKGKLIRPVMVKVSRSG